MRKGLKRIWYFLWEEDSIWSWIVNIIVAFLLIKFIVYPGLGLALGTKFPVVAVISNSMEHDGSFEQWWQRQGTWYEGQSIGNQEFLTYPFSSGFNKGDIMVLIGKKPEQVKKGDVIVFENPARREPIIHRVVAVREEHDVYYYTTKGDKNFDSYPFEQDIMYERFYGKAVLKVPLLGYVKIIFMEIVNMALG